MNDAHVVQLPGARFRTELLALTTELVTTIDLRSPFPIARVFQAFDLSDDNRALQDKILSRGVFEPSISGTFTNDGPRIDTLVRDIAPEVGAVQLVMPRRIQIRAKAHHDTIELELVDTRVLLNLFGRPAPGIGGRYLLRTLVMTPESSTYRFASEDADRRDLALQVAYGVSGLAPSEAHEGPSHSSFKLLARSSALEDGCCGTVRTRRPPPDVPPGPRCVRLHAKILHPPQQSVETYVAAMNAVFAAADVTVRLVSTETLHLPDLLDVEVGRCHGGDPMTPDQTRLFGHRRHAETGDICAYWVRSLIPGSLAGCAAHPRGLPSVVCYPHGTPYLLAHEVGHVLGLEHVQSDDRLMWTVDNFRDPPPDIDALEIARIRRSASIC